MALEAYIEIMHFSAVRWNMENNIASDVREKHSAAWKMYQLEYPALIASLLKHKMEPDGLATFDWKSVKQIFEDRKNEI